jgi:uncharacterized protein YceH (UPF0502 family)
MNLNLLLWAQIVSRLAMVVAAEKGAAPRELAYLHLLTDATTFAAMTDADLTDLLHKYESERAANVETTADELEQIAARIQARGERIQSA